MYGFLLLGVNIIIGICYLSYCLKYFEECRLRFIWDGQLFREAFSFTGWTLFGAFSTVLRNQALTVLFNQFFGAVAVAARTIALSISGTVTVFANSFSTGINPTIVKEYAAGRKESMLSLVLSGSKLTFFLTWIFALPMFIHMDFVLQIWLGTLIEDVVLFSRLALIETLIFSISICLAAAARAPGKMKAYESILGTLQIMIFVFSYFLFSIGFDAETAFYVAIAINILMFFVRLVMVRSLIGLSIRVFFRNALVLSRRSGCIHICRKVSLIVFVILLLAYCYRLQQCIFWVWTRICGKKSITGYCQG
jgi:O-antigen/teichoic acid export membrane protein